MWNTKGLHDEYFKDARKNFAYEKFIKENKLEEYSHILRQAFYAGWDASISHFSNQVAELSQSAATKIIAKNK